MMRSVHQPGTAGEVHEIFSYTRRQQLKEFRRAALAYKQIILWITPRPQDLAACAVKSAALLGAEK